MKATIAILPGDGIGPEVNAQAVRVLERVAALRELELELREGLVGGAAIEATGAPLPPSTLELCDDADAILLGAVGGPEWDDLPADRRPERGLLTLRAELGLFANLRPVRSREGLARNAPLRPDLLRDVDLLFVRELTGGIYFGPRRDDGDTALDTCVYRRHEVERVVRTAAELARGRRRRLTSVDKANVLATSRLWRRTVEEVVSRDYPDLELEHLLVDAAAMHLLRRPGTFDVVVTGNLFGDILSDEASVLAGSLGMLPSASLAGATVEIDAADVDPGSGRRRPAGLYEPVHGSAPEIAGEDVANPYAAILCVALMLRHSLGRFEEAAAVEGAVDDAVDDGVLPRDLAAPDDTRTSPATTEAAGDAVLARLDRRLRAG